MTQATPRLGIRLLSACVMLLLLATPALAATEPTMEARGSTYRSDLGQLPALQNSDGGFGRALAADNGSAAMTDPTRAALLETVMTVHLLRAEDTDPFDTWTNWEGRQTSLAASNVSNALDWLRAHEAETATGEHPEDLALVALAYARLGDAGNARRVIVDRLDAEGRQPGTIDSGESGRLLYAHGVAAPATNATHNATLDLLADRLATDELNDPGALAWGLLAQPDHATRRADLHRVVDQAGHLSDAQLTLAAWALAESGGPDDFTETLLRDAYRASPVGLARAYYLLGEHAAHPEFGPNSPVGPISYDQGGTGIATGARGSATSSSTQDDAYRNLLEENQRLRDALATETTQDGTGSAFPLPSWLMAGTLLVAIAIVVIYGLAYGLKREDLEGSRKDIFEFIEANPGQHFSKIRRELGLAPGTFQHHLGVLESEGWITSHKDSRFKRYFVNGNRYQQLIAGHTYKQKFAALANTTTRDLVRYVQQHPGATQKMVASRLQLHPSTVNWHAKRLAQAGLMESERVGKEVRYTVDGDTAEKILRSGS